jgi:chromosome segregation ATPase
MPKLKSLRAIPKADIHVVEPPPLEAEPPHRKIARLTSEQERLVREIQEHKTAWAQRNFQAQNKRQTISSAELTAFQAHHSDLAKALAEVNLAIGETNRQVRQHKAELQAWKANPNPPEPVRRNGIKQTAPIKRHVAFPSYFMLAAEVELPEGMFKKVVATAKSMLGDAITNGVEEGDR